jgi:hypothetical protein
MPKERPIMVIETERAGPAGPYRTYPFWWGEGTSLGAGVWIREFACGACGAVGFSTGTANLEPGTVLPYHKQALAKSSRS